MLVVPAATARNLAGSMSGLFWVAVISSWTAGIAGILLSFYLNTPVGAATILISCTFFLFSWIKIRWLS
jgi:zinc transport system permease protein